MDELKDVSIHHTALKILSDITSQPNYNEAIYKTVQVIFEDSRIWCFCPEMVISPLRLHDNQRLVCSPDVDKVDLKRTLEEAIKANGLDTEIRNIVYHLLRSSGKCEKYTAQSVSFAPIMPHFAKFCRKNGQKKVLSNGSIPFAPFSLTKMPRQNDSLNYLRRSGVLWERRVRKSLNSMCNELEVTLQGQLRTCAEREELLAKWDELSNHQIG